MSEAYLDTIKRIEPDIAMIDRDAALASIAISLKRIADAMENSPLPDKIEAAVATGIWEGANNALGAWLRSR